MLKKGDICLARCQFSLWALWERGDAAFNQADFICCKAERDEVMLVLEGPQLWCSYTGMRVLSSTGYVGWTYEHNLAKVW